MTDHSYQVIKAKNEIIGTKVVNNVDEDLGELIEVMIDKNSGKVAYIVLESGSFLGLGGKLFALPWHSLKYDKQKECFILNIDKEKLKNAPGFDQDHWPDMADRQWGELVYQYYGASNYWE